MTAHTYLLAPPSAPRVSARRMLACAKRLLVGAAVIVARARIRRACIEAEMVCGRWQVSPMDGDRPRNRG
jgi:hypothetical protein